MADDDKKPSDSNPPLSSSEPSPPIVPDSKPVPIVSQIFTERYSRADGNILEKSAGSNHEQGDKDSGRDDKGASKNDKNG